MVKENLNHFAIIYFNVSFPSGISKMNGVAYSSRIPQANLPPVLSFVRTCKYSIAAIVLLIFEFLILYGKFKMSYASQK
jgi:hypothetical protein